MLHPTSNNMLFRRHAIAAHVNRVLYNTCHNICYSYNRYNIIPDLPCPPPPPLHPKTLQPITADDLKPLFPMGLIEQEVTTERYREIV